MEYDIEEYDFEARYADDLDALEELEHEASYDLFENQHLKHHLETIPSNQRESENALQCNDDKHKKSALMLHGTSLKTAESELIHSNLQNSVILPTENAIKETASDKRMREDPDAIGLDEHYIQQSGKWIECISEPYFSEENKVLKRIPSGSYVSVTSSNGSRVYVRLLHKKEDEEATFCKLGEMKYNSTSMHFLLPTPCRELRMQLEKEREAKFFQEMQKSDDNMSDVPNDNASIGLGEGTHSKQLSDHELWVERFKPCNYLELLSDDGTNRTLLRWLKLWDKVVFNKEIKWNDSSKNINKDSQKQYNKFKKKVLPDVNKELDNLNCPIQKIALLCGPPGLGKTTLAHIIAKHAGYNVVEMNASDDRSPEAFRTQIESATQMRAVFGKDPKPNCLIIDEIDGAPMASINVLVNIISAKHQEPTNKVKKSQRRELGLLLRPIICICNDQYVPALRPLRNLALVLNFPPTLPTRLASRLLEVARKQSMKTDLSTLLALCEKAENDIRSCLATLQFIHGKLKQLKLSDVHSLSVGNKDIQKSLFSVWQDIFQIPRMKRKRAENNIISLNPGAGGFDVQSVFDESTMSARFHKIVRLVQSYGDTEKIHQGLFENFLSMKYRDHCLQVTSLGIDWLCYADIIMQDVHHSQNYSLMGYLPFTSVMFHMLFASNSYQKIKFPTAHFELKTNCTRSENLLVSLLNEMTPLLHVFVNSTNLILDILPYLLHIIQPQFRPVNSQLYSNQERSDLEHLIDIMIAYNLTYQQQIGQDGQYNYILDPQMDIVGSFPGMKTHRPMTYAAKQMIAREIELEKVRRTDLIHQQTKASTIRKNAPPEIKCIPNHKQTLQPRQLKMEEKTAVDFFGRVIQTTSIAKEETKSSTNELGKGNIWFRFKEGYSNAVRKNVRMQDL